MGIPTRYHSHRDSFQTSITTAPSFTRSLLLPELATGRNNQDNTALPTAFRQMMGPGIDWGLRHVFGRSSFAPLVFPTILERRDTTQPWNQSRTLGTSHDPMSRWHLRRGIFQPISVHIQWMSHPHLLSDQLAGDCIHVNMPGGGNCQNPCQRGYLCLDTSIIQLGWCFQEVVSRCSACRNSRVSFISYKSCWLDYLLLRRNASRPIYNSLSFFF